MAISEETKHKLMKAAPWIIGGLFALFLVARAGKGGQSRQDGAAPVQDLSMLGGGYGAPAMQQPQVVPAEVADQFAGEFGSSRERFAAMRDFWQQQQEDVHGQRTGRISKAWEQLTSGEWIGIKVDNRGMILSDEEARRIASKNHGPYAEGGGGWFKENIGKPIRDLIGRPLTLRTGLEVYAATQGYPTPNRGTAPRANGAQSTRPPTATRPPGDDTLYT